MTRRVTIAELRKMGVKDLQGEISGKRIEVAKMRLGIVMQKEKDTGRYRSEKKQLARMLTVLNEKKQRNQESQKSQMSTTSLP